jgi:signal transduction histidine kinase
MISNEQASEFLRSLPVLCVEDDPAVLAGMASFLRRRVGNLATAASGAEGLAAFRSQAPGMVITDILMPGMDGLEMAEAIRALAPGVPIIIITAFEQTHFMQRSIDLGIDRYVVKPINVDRLDAALIACARRLLLEQKAAQQQELEKQLLRMRHQAAMGVLLGGIAHDYNNLFQALMTLLDLTRTQVDPAGQAAETLNLTRLPCGQARVLGRRLLSLTSGSHRGDQFGPVPPLVREKVLGLLAGTRVEASFDFQDGGTPLWHHGQDFGLMVEALTRNALDAMPGGGAFRVSSRLRPGDAGPDGDPARGPCLELRFADTGSGIAPEVLPRIFEPYFSTKPRGSQKGMGLDLAICEAVARSHRGSVRAESEPGKGAVFTVLLPVAEAEGKQA